MTTTQTKTVKATRGVDYDLRTALDSDLHFVRESWRRSYERMKLARAPSLKQFIAAQRGAIEAALATSQVTVAYWLAEPDEILGWTCHREGVVHYVYVKDVSRGIGIGRCLWDTASEGKPRIWVTHDTPKLPLLRKGQVTVLNPFLVFGDAQ